MIRKLCHRANKDDGNKAMMELARARSGGHLTHRGPCKMVPVQEEI